MDAGRERQSTYRRNSPEGSRARPANEIAIENGGIGMGCDRGRTGRVDGSGDEPRAVGQGPWAH
jgi:hypothetical protein